MSNEISVYIEPSKRKLNLDVQPEATVGQIVQGLVAHLKAAAQGFDVEHYLRDRIGDGYAPEWQLFRENENMQLLPPDARMTELQPPLEADELFTLKVNAKVAANVVHLSELGRAIQGEQGPLLCGAPVVPGTSWLNAREWTPGWSPEGCVVCQRCVEIRENEIEAKRADKAPPGDGEMPKVEIELPGNSELGVEVTPAAPDMVLGHVGPVREKEEPATLELKPPSHAQVPKIEVHEGPVHLALPGGAATLCTRPLGPGDVIIPDRNWRPPAAAASIICPDCLKRLVPDAELCHLTVKGQTHTLCGRSTAPEVMTIPDRDWRVPPATRRVAGHTFCPDCLTILEAPIDIHLTDQKEFVWKGKMRVTPEPMPAASNVRYLRSSDRIKQAHGYYWPDGAPETLPPQDDLQIFAFVDTEGETFTIAYTKEQISEQVATQGCFAPYFPASFGAPLPLPPAPAMEITPPADHTAQEVRVFRELMEKLDPDDEAVLLAQRLTDSGTPFDFVLNPDGGVTVRVRPGGLLDASPLGHTAASYDDAGALALALLADRIPHRVMPLGDKYHFCLWPKDREADVEQIIGRLDVEGWSAPAIEPRDKR